ncbi:MAG TPA: FAD-binding oxidoreductase [Acidimicrobiia bacterium]|nr:FAD-binding oxidoreductase [Acidimicrobiia bacterium]
MAADGDRIQLALSEVVGAGHVLTDLQVIAGYVTDWTGRWQGTTTAVVRPGSPAEVAGVVKVCREAGIPLVPQGGNTGLVGGSVPHHGEVVLSLRRLDELGPVDYRSRQVTAGAGTTIGALQDHAARAGLAYGVDLASRGSATVGGTIATNAGGLGVVAHGDTRRQIVGLQAVLPDGTLFDQLNGIEKQSMGPDLSHLLVGSEGTLGVITAARLRLVTPLTADRAVTLVGVDRLADGLDLLVPGVTALEFFDRACLQAVCAHRQLPRPLSLDADLYVLVESPAVPDLAPDAPAVVDRRLWTYRESITETLNRRGVPCKLDVSVPVARLDEFLQALTSLELGGEVFCFGHLAEGNVHVNVIGAPDPERLTGEVLRLVVALGGAVASEHGIGIAKAKWWRLSTDPGVYAASRRIKQALDPWGLFNPAVLWGRADEASD